jgi:hypothetical protein
MSYYPYSEDELQEWDSVCNPMGDACYQCDECECDHWAGDHTAGCPHMNPDCLGEEYFDLLDDDY